MTADLERLNAYCESLGLAAPDDGDWTTPLWAEWAAPNKFDMPFRYGRYEGYNPTDSLGATLLVTGGTGYLHVNERAALMLKTRFVHDPLMRADYKAWGLTGRPDVGDEWSAYVSQNAWNTILERDHGWDKMFTELLAHIMAESGLIEIGYSIYSSCLSETGEAWARLLLAYDEAQNDPDNQQAPFLAMVPPGYVAPIPSERNSA